MDVNPYESPQADDKPVVESESSRLRGMLMALAIAIAGLILAALRL
jgi:hypothetical protein